MPATAPNLIVEPFGIDAVPTTNITQPIPVSTGSAVRASYNLGFPPDTMIPISSGGSWPYGQDMNGILYDITSNIAAFTGGQMWPFNSTWATDNGGYAFGAIIPMASGLGFWVNLEANNSNDPDTYTPPTSSGWLPLASVGTASVPVTSGTVTLTAGQAACPIINVTGALSGNVTLIFPSWAIRPWTVINNTTGGFSVICQAGGSHTVIVAQGGSTVAAQVFVDQANNLQQLGGGGTVGSSGIGYVSSPVTLSSSPTTVATVGGLVGGGTYAMEAQLYFTAAGGAGTLTSTVVPATTGSVTPVGNNFNQSIDAANSLFNEFGNAVIDHVRIRGGCRFHADSGDPARRLHAAGRQ